MTTQETISPINGAVYLERELANDGAIEASLTAAERAQRAWRGVSLEKRAETLSAFVEGVVARAPQLADELTWQMGRPLAQTPGELRGFGDRGRTMIRIGLEQLEDAPLPAVAGLRRFVRREPRGVVLTLAPWNYPWLTSVNVVVPALMAGNAVLLKHSAQTPLVAERMVETALEAGVPEGVFQFLHVDHAQLPGIIEDRRVAHVAFTGSVEGGRAVHRAAAGRFIHVGLELGGKDPGYVCEDADVAAAAAGLVDGAFFNSGQSCCGIERIYVHRSRFDDFIEQAVALVRAYRLGDPTDMETTLGPVVRASNAAAIDAQVAAALASGARSVVDASAFPVAAERGAPYLAPRLLVDVDHSMELMREETFGPVVGVMPVESDDEAVRLMNDSRYGLTASIWSSDLEHGLAVGERVETGTVFVNRCDYLDPELPWVGVKDSGVGATLSAIGYEHLTRPRSFHAKASG